MSPLKDNRGQTGCQNILFISDDYDDGGHCSSQSLFFHLLIEPPSLPHYYKLIQIFKNKLPFQKQTNIQSNASVT